VPHEYASWEKKWRGDRRKSENIAKAFRKWLKEKIPQGFEGTPRCRKKAKGSRKQATGRRKKSKERGKK
jgi:hypothetical protein